MMVLPSDAVGGTDPEDAPGREGRQQDNAEAPEPPLAVPSAEASAEPSAPSSIRDQLPEAIRNHACFEQISTLDELAELALKRFENGKHLERVLGKKLNRLDRDDVLSILGRPESPDAYRFTDVDLPGGMAWDSSLETQFRNWAFNAGLTNGQANELGEQFAAHAVASAARQSDQMRATRQQALHHAHAELRREWGETTETRIAFAQEALARFGGEALVERLAATGLDSDPELLRFIDRTIDPTAAAVGEDGNPFDETNAAIPAGAAAQNRIAARYRDEDFMRAYTSPDHPRHAAAVTEMQALFRASRP